jgi:hypothetical protein
MSLARTGDILTIGESGLIFGILVESDVPEPASLGILAAALAALASVSRLIGRDPQ